MTKYLTVVFFFLATLVKAQEVTVDSLLADLQLESDTQSLLPERMLFTQRALWGQNGLYRKVGIAPKTLTAETREHELKVRRTMLKIHQGVGITTAAAMLAQGIVGSKLYRNYSDDLKKVHTGLATGINIGYITTGLMSFAAPPPLVTGKRFDNIKLHKTLAIVHISGMIATNILSHQIAKSQDPQQLRTFHKAAAFTTFGAYAAAIASVKFEF